MPPEPSTLLVVANSARSMAESAVRGGYDVHALDGFCDQDTRELVPCILVPMAGPGLDASRLRAEVERLVPAGADAAAGAAAGGDVGLVYGAGLEPCPGLLSRLQRRVRLMGNDPQVLALLGRPERLLDLLAELGIAHPETRLDPPRADGDADEVDDWLTKEPGTSGGLGVRTWQPGDPRPTSPHYFQRRLPGVPMSLLFIADGSRHAVIGYNRLLVTEDGPERPFLYGGVLGQAELDAAGCREVEGWCQALVERLGLRGINGLDFILHQGRPYFLELNARPCASLSLYEWQCEEGWICRHVRACLGELPEPAAVPRGRVWGQRIVYAPQDLAVPPDLDWPDWCRDRPMAGTSVPRGAPLCSVLADAAEPVCVEVRLAARVICVLGLLEHGQMESGPQLAGDPSAGTADTGTHPEPFV